MLGKIDVETYPRTRLQGRAAKTDRGEHGAREGWMEAANKASPEVRQDLEATAEREGVPQAARARMLNVDGESNLEASALPGSAPTGREALYDVAVDERALPRGERSGQAGAVLQCHHCRESTAAPLTYSRFPRVRRFSRRSSRGLRCASSASTSPPQLMCTAGNTTIGVNALRAATPPRWTGRGETIAVFDSGIDVDHPDLAAAMQQGALPMAGARPHDDIGHGTHVAGIIAGRGTRGGPPGVATEAGLIDRTMVNASGKLILPLDYEELFAPAAAAGAKIFNLSWGWPIGGSYDQGARQVDEYAYAHPRDSSSCLGRKFRIASNGTSDFKTLAAPASAKNVLTVGACSLRCTCTSNCACKQTQGQKWPSPSPFHPPRPRRLSPRMAIP